MNRLYFGDNLEWLRDRREFPEANIDLVYLDPPFNSNADYNVLFRAEKDSSIMELGEMRSHNPSSAKEDPAILYRALVRGVPRWAEQPSEADLKLCGGSAFLWQSDRAKFLVTAHHVWAEFRDRILERPGRCLIFCLDRDHAIPIFGVEPVSVDQDLDLAVLAGPGIENLKLDEKAFFRQPPFGTIGSVDRRPSRALWVPKRLTHC